MCSYLALVPQLVSQTVSVKRGGAEMYCSRPPEGDRDTLVSHLRSIHFTHLSSKVTPTEQHFSADNGCLAFSYLTLLETLVRGALAILFCPILQAPSEHKQLKQHDKESETFTRVFKTTASALTTIATILVSHDAEL